MIKLINLKELSKN